MKWKEVLQVKGKEPSDNSVNFSWWGNGLGSTDGLWTYRWFLLEKVPGAQKWSHLSIYRFDLISWKFPQPAPPYRQISYRHTKVGISGVSFASFFFFCCLGQRCSLILVSNDDSIYKSVQMFTVLIKELYELACSIKTKLQQWWGYILKWIIIIIITYFWTIPLSCVFLFSISSLF